MSKIIAIDGPAGSGKSTVTKIISKRCNLMNLDTGATYRCVALKVLKENVSLDDENKIVELAKKINIKFENDKVYLDDIDVTKEIRDKEVTKIVSPLSSNVKLREVMVELQRKLASNYDIITEGRDTTTVVFPSADIKIYLDASLEERVKRRFIENQEKNIDMSYEEIKENIIKRDYNDTHKEVGSLIKTDEQIYIDTTNLNIDEVVNKIENIIKER